MWIMFLYRIDVGPLSDRYADIPTSYRYLSDMGMLTGTGPHALENHKERVIKTTRMVLAYKT